MLSLGIALPSVAVDYAAIKQYENLDTRQILWEWTNNNIVPQGRILTREGDSLSRTWNRWWGGYNGETTFEWWFESSIPQNTAEEYAERGIYYFAITDEDLKTGYHRDNPEVQAFVDELVHLKTIDASVPGVTGDSIHFYRMLPPAVETDVRFDGRIILAGYDLDTADLKPGSTLHLRPYWRISDYPRSNYSMFVHLYPEAEEQVLAQNDGPPSHIKRPTLTWNDQDELYTGSDVVMQIPADLEPGAYRLALGLYDFLTGERLSLDSGDTFFTIPVTLSE